MALYVGDFLGFLFCPEWMKDENEPDDADKDQGRRDTDAALPGSVVIAQRDQQRGLRRR